MSTTAHDRIWKQRCCWCNWLRWGHIGAGWAPNPFWLGSSWEGEIWILGDTHSGRMPCEHEDIEGMCRLAKDDQVAGESLQARTEVWRRPFPSVALPTSWFWTSSLQDCETINFCSLTHSVCSICYGCPSRLTPRRSEREFQALKNRPTVESGEDGMSTKLGTEITKFPDWKQTFGMDRMRIQTDLLSREWPAVPKFPFTGLPIT